jgi:hypothetical protein
MRLVVACLFLTLLGAPPASSAGRDDAAAQILGLDAASPRVLAFLKDLQATYLAPKHLTVGRLEFSELAKLIGYAVGEAATHPGPVDVFDEKFKMELEAWIVGIAAENMRPGVAAKAWRLIEEGARGFYDSEMEAKFGHRPEAAAPLAAPVSAVAWFDALSPADKEGFLQRGVQAGLKNDEGTSYTVKQFKALAHLFDLEMEARGLSPSERSAAVRNLGEAGLGRTN